MRGPQRPQMYVRPFSGRGTPARWSAPAEPKYFSSAASWDRFALNPNINGQQMRMLIDPEEHQNMVTRSIDRFGSESMGDVWEYKEEEARAPAEEHWTHGSGTYDWIESGEPQRQAIELRLGGGEGEEEYGQGEGHHRVAAAAAVQRDTGEKRLIKMEAQRGYRGSSDFSDMPSYEDLPTPTPASQRETEKLRSNPKQGKLIKRTWDPQADDGWGRNRWRKATDPTVPKRRFAARLGKPQPAFPEGSD